jgi:uncharacterized protein YybS (DUF2232 family)
MVLPESVREELLKQFLFAMESVLRGSLPSWILQGSMLGGVLCVAWSRRVAAKFATRMATAPTEPFHRWRMSGALVRPLVIAYLAVAVLAMMSQAQALFSLSDVLWGGFSLMLALQGGAVLSFLMRRGGVRPAVRALIVGALLVMSNLALTLFGGAGQAFNLLALLGVIDLVFNLRKRRGAPEERDEEEDES